MERIEGATVILLNFTWVLFLICIACMLIYAALEMVKQLKTKQLLDEDIFAIIKEDASKYLELSSKIICLRNDLDSLGKKTRDLESKILNHNHQRT